MIGARSGRQLLLLLAAAGILVLAACSGSGDSASTTDGESSAQETSTPAPAAQAPRQAPGGGFGGGFGQIDGAQIDEAQIAALTVCLEERGFEVPDDATTLQELFGGGPPSAELQEALGDCGTAVGVTLPGGFVGGRGGFGGGGGGGRFGGGAADREALLDCLSAEGLDVEFLSAEELAPDGGGAPGQGGPFAGLDLDDPDVQAALEVCAPGFGTRSGGQ